MSRLAWFKSSYSTGSGGNCIEVATATATVHVRDSKDPHGPTLAFGRDAWAGFLALARAHGGDVDEV